MSATTPDAFDRWGERVADRVNPIVVKEVRQGLRTRVFWVFFSLMLVGCLAISLFAWAANDGIADDTGQYAFVAYFVALGFVQFFVIPYASYRSMAREAEDETWVLLTLTGLGPRRILAGKLASAVLQGALYASAATPFLLFSYFLNGIDLPTIVVGVIVATGYQVFLVAVAVSLATLAESKLVRALLHFVLLGVLLQGLGFGIGGAVTLGEVARRASSSAEFWLAAGSVLFGVVTTGVLLFESAAARLALPTEDYVRGPRLAYAVQFLGMLGLFLAGWRLSGEAEVLTAASVAVSVYATFVGLFVGSDRDGMAKLHWATGSRYALLKPGGYRGLLFVVGLLALATAVLAFLGLREASFDEGALRVLLAAPAFALVMLCLPWLVARWVPHPPWQTPAMVRIVFLGLLVLMTGVPPLLGEIISEADDVVLNALNPIVGLINIERRDADGPALMLLAWGIAGGLLAWTLSSLRSRDTEWLT